MAETSNPGPKLMNQKDVEREYGLPTRAILRAALRDALVGAALREL